MVSPEGIAEGETEAERRARDDKQRTGKERMKQIRQQAWWARMWRDETSPYKMVTLNDEQLALKEQIRHMLPHKCFDNSRGLYAGDHRDAEIVCESLALKAKVLMTSNLRTINHEALNAWVVEEGRSVGHRRRAARPAVHLASARAHAHRQERAGSARPRDRDTLAVHRRPGPGLQARAVRQTRRARVLGRRVQWPRPSPSTGNETAGSSWPRPSVAGTPCERRCLRGCSSSSTISLRAEQRRRGRR